MIFGSNFLQISWLPISASDWFAELLSGVFSLLSDKDNLINLVVGLVLWLLIGAMLEYFPGGCRAESRTGNHCDDSACEKCGCARSKKAS